MIVLALLICNSAATFALGWILSRGFDGRGGLGLFFALLGVMGVSGFLLGLRTAGL